MTFNKRHNNKRPMRIGVLGSTCNPPHKGHTFVGNAAKRALKLDRLIFMPTKTPPHKAKPDVPAKLRLEMAHLLAEKRKGWMVSDMEIKRPGTSYTQDTIKELKLRYPKDEIYWVIGSDSFVAMPWQWKGGYKILDLCKFVVVTRKGYSIRCVPKIILKKVIILAGQKLNVSSTKIRDSLKEGKNVDSFLDRPIMRFIQRHNLYRT